MKQWLKDLWCKLTGHAFYAATEECDSHRCMKCGKWFESSKAFGRWII